MTRDKKKIKKLFVSGEAFFYGGGVWSLGAILFVLREDYVLPHCFVSLFGTFFDALLSLINFTLL